MAKKFVQNDNNLAIAYYRFSSHAQNECSIEQQQEMAQEYAEKHGYTIIKEYADRAISGTTDERPQYQLMLYEVSKLKPAVLILWKTDRLNRDRVETAIAKKKIRDAGCSIQYVAEAVDTETPEGVLMEGILETMAEFYSKQLRVNVTRGMQYNARNCLYNGHKTLGYGVDDTKHYIEDESTAGIVRRIFNDYVNGKPVADICQELNSQGVTTTLGRKFNHNGIRHILRNRMYIGEYHYGDIVVPDGVPALISEDLFDAAGRKMESNKHKPKSPDAESDMPRFWLTGKLYCGLCGESMHGISGTSRHGYKCYYYACKNHRKHKCEMQNVSKRDIENQVEHIIAGFLSDTDQLLKLTEALISHHQKSQNDDSFLKSLQAELSEAEKGINNLVKVIERGMFSEAVMSRLNALEERKTAIIEAIQAEEAKRALTDDSGLRLILNDLTDISLHQSLPFSDELRNQILEFYVDKIYLYPDDLVVTFWSSDDRTPVHYDKWNSEIELRKGAKGSTCEQSAPYIGTKKTPSGCLFLFLLILFGGNPIDCLSAIYSPFVEIHPS